MVKDGRATQSPVAHLDGLNVKTDRRRDRRALSIEDLRKLLDATRTGPERFGMAAADRAMLYRLAAETGLRRGELESLTRSSFNLNPKAPTVTVEAGYSKHRRQDVLPLRVDTAAELAATMAHKLPHALAFNMPADRRVSAMMFRQDIEAAGLPYSDEAGRFADFHSLRHTFGTNLARAGIQPKQAMDLMRHSDINLTMARYSHTVIGEQAVAVAALPDLSESASAAVLMQATDDAPVTPDATAGRAGCPRSEDRRAAGPVDRSKGEKISSVSQNAEDGAEEISKDEIEETADSRLALCLALSGMGGEAQRCAVRQTDDTQATMTAQVKTDEKPSKMAESIMNPAILDNGEGGIRTHGTLACTPVFETGPIGHSGTSPAGRHYSNYSPPGKQTPL